VSATTAPTGASFETVSTEAAFAALADSWDDLVRAMPRPSPHLLHGWLLSWWRHYGDEGGLAVHVAYCGDKLVAALPLCVRRSHGLDVLTFLGAEQVSLADMLLTGDAGEDVAAQLAERATTTTEHDFADFHGLPGSSRFVSALGPSRLRLIVRAEAPVLELGDLDWETFYETRLSRNQRALHRRRNRQLAKLGAVETTIARTREELATALEDAFELHARRWQGRPDGSDFGTTAGKEFQREGTAALAELDIPRIVTLKLDGRPIAFAYYFKLENTMCCHRLAFDPELGRLSPGLVNRYDAMENAVAEGATRVEFFGGTERYKMELTDKTEPLHEGLGLPGSVAGKAVVAARLNRIRLRRFVKRSPAIRRFYYEALAPARRRLHVGNRS
jgi:CelD/BcsL family acetyltransferase involved in cellulose biosynthesis